MGGQVQLLRGPMAQLLGRVSMALAPAPAHNIHPCILLHIWLQKLAPINSKHVSRGMGMQPWEAHEGRKGQMVTSWLCIVRQCREGGSPALAQGLLDAGSQLQQFCLHLLVSCYRPANSGVRLLVPALGNHHSRLHSTRHISPEQIPCLGFLKQEIGSSSANMSGQQQHDFCACVSADRPFRIQ